ncbi:hypothetical protein AYI68_g4050 [Smittium mucronatum]|uniref:Uncharacterized protein n=1 Tax=Smittium mucronatum TaxID=133383 RepID=A0A1R0GY73_9FUNG|nr:hypothetical protein AYI68_g4050 [Smittium mucronatum]
MGRIYYDAFEDEAYKDESPIFFIDGDSDSIHSAYDNPRDSHLKQISTLPFEDMDELDELSIYSPEYISASLASHISFSPFSEGDCKPSKYAQTEPSFPNYKIPITPLSSQIDILNFRRSKNNLFRSRKRSSKKGHLKEYYSECTDISDSYNSEILEMKANEVEIKSYIDEQVSKTVDLFNDLAFQNIQGDGGIKHNETPKSTHKIEVEIPPSMYNETKKMVSLSSIKKDLNMNIKKFTKKIDRYPDQDYWKPISSNLSSKYSKNLTSLYSYNIDFKTEKLLL